MAYNWWVLLHLVGVFGFLAAHGVSMAAAFRLRRERDPAKVNELLQLSASSTRWFYVSLGVLALGGIAAGFAGHWWSQAWMWFSIGVLVVVMVLMYALAQPFYRKVGVIARAKAGGSEAVTDEQFDALLRSRTPDVVTLVGVLGLVALIYLMLFKPTFASSSPGTPIPVASGSGSGTGSVLRETAGALSFGTVTLRAPADTSFTIVFDNQAPGVVHNVAVYRDASAAESLFTGDLITGPKTVTYHVSALPAGSYFFRCDAHPQQMTGTLVVS
jgi:plastocyanin